MVAVVTKRAGVRYQCEECKLLYRERDWAEKCEEWCRMHHSCNLDIISHAEPNET